MNGGGEVFINYLLRLCPILDAERSAQYFDVSVIFCWPARYELACQNISQVIWYI